MRDVPGCPDFVFVDRRIAVFVDGCFWHGCRRCARNLPHSRQEFWSNKIDRNRKRDRAINRRLRADGYIVIRIWEHSLADSRWLTRLLEAIQRRAPV